jgi:xanthine dehydrogenase accessory factor
MVQVSEDEFLDGLAEELARGQTVAVATVLSTRGSTPRGAGARMLVRRDGSSRGTVGGGCGESEVRQAALDVLDTGRARFIDVDLTGEIARDSDGVCGGVMRVFVEPWRPEEAGEPASTGRGSG